MSSVDAPLVTGVLARVVVDDIAHALPVYEQLSGGAAVRRFAFRDVELAWVGHFLLLSGPGASLAEYQRVATVLVSDLDAVGTIITATGGVVLEGPSDAPNGPRLIARHADGASFEYIELR